MNYLFGWNAVAEFIVDELHSTGTPVGGVIVDDAYLQQLTPPTGITLIPASSIRFAPGQTVINCLGYRDLGRRIKVGEQLQTYQVLRSFVSQQARVHTTAVVENGAVLLGDVLVERNCRIGAHSLLWGGSRVCHDSVIGRGVFMAAGSIVGGVCKVGDTSSIGFNSSMREKSTMPAGTKVGANRFWRPDTT